MKSPKDIFEGLHYQVTWSNGFYGGRGKRGALVEKKQRPMAKKCCCNETISESFFRGKEYEDKRRQGQEKTRGWSNSIFNLT
jgi:hypothetical protein